MNEVAPFIFADQEIFNRYTHTTRYQLLTQENDQPPEGGTNLSWSWRDSTDMPGVREMVIDIKYMPADTAYMIEFTAKARDGWAGISSGNRYYAQAAFTADYNCIIVDKVWLPENPEDPTVVDFWLSVSGEALPYSAHAVKKPTLENGVLRAVWSQLDYYDEQGVPISYTVHENAVLAGYTLSNTMMWTEGKDDHIKRYVFTNVPQTSLTAVKKWVGDTQEQRSPVYLMLAKRIADDKGQFRLSVPASPDGSPLYGAIAVDLSQDEFSTAFLGIPTLEPDGTPIDYTVVEARNNTAPFNLLAPLGYLRDTQTSLDNQGNKVVTITNTRQEDLPPLDDGDLSDPCIIKWYNKIVYDASLWGSPGYDYNRYKVSGAYFTQRVPKPSEGLMVTQVYTLNDTKIGWRVVMATNNELHNGTLTIDLNELISQGMVVDMAGSMVKLDFIERQSWLDNSAGLDHAYRGRYALRVPDYTASYENNILTINIPRMDAYSAIAFSLNTTLTSNADYYRFPGDAPYMDGVRFAMETNFTADTRCVNVEKSWLGDIDASQQAVVGLTLNGVPLMDNAREQLLTQLDTTFVNQAPDFTGYEALRVWANEMDRLVPGFFNQLFLSQQAPLQHNSWNVTWGVPKEHSYTFNQTELDFILDRLEGIYQVTLHKDNGFAYTWGELPWHEPDSYGIVEIDMTEGWQPFGEVQRQMDEHRVLLSLSNIRMMDIKASKTWDGGPVDDHHAVPLVLTRKLADGLAQEVTTPAYTHSGTSSVFNYIWSGLPAVAETGEPYIYTVTEENVDLGKVLINGNLYAVTQTGNDITNTYVQPSPAEVVIKAQKQLEGGSLAAGQFSFNLMDQDSTVLQAAVPNAADSSITFAPHLFVEAGEYELVVQEVPGTAAGISYDSKEWHLYYLVTLDGDNMLKAELTRIVHDNNLVDLSATPVFQNVVQPGPTPTASSSPTPTATASPTPTATASPTPTATASPTPTAIASPTPTVTASPTPTATASPTPTATASPTPTAAASPTPTATASPTPTATASPTPAATSTPSPTPTATPAPTPKPSATPTRVPQPSFDPIAVGVRASKTLNGGTLKEGQFEFVIKDRQGTVIERVRNDAQGNIVFSDRRFSRTGTFLYTIEEILKQDDTITYDNTRYEIKVVISAAGNTLSAQVHLSKNGTPFAGDISFINRVNMPKTGDSNFNLLMGLSIASLLLGGLWLLLVKRHKAKQ